MLEKIGLGAIFAVVLGWFIYWRKLMNDSDKLKNIEVENEVNNKVDQSSLESLVKLANDRLRKLRSKLGDSSKKE